jgi:hypothetical protein
MKKTASAQGYAEYARERRIDSEIGDTTGGQTVGECGVAGFKDKGEGAFGDAAEKG